MTRDDWPPAGWTRRTHRHESHDHPYYELAPEGSPDAAGVILLHEFPGISAHLVEFAGELAGRFRVVVPSILGRDGDPGLSGVVTGLCIRREVYAFRRGRTSRAVAWLRVLADQVLAGPAGRPYGVVGMCMTGNVALALAVDPRVRAAVVAQPALPLSRLQRHLPLPRSAGRAADLGLSDEDRDALRARVVADPEALCVRGYRFRDDWQSPPEKLTSTAELLGPDTVRVVTLTEPRPDAHSTLTGPNRNQAAVDEVIRFLHQRLSGDQ